MRHSGSGGGVTGVSGTLPTTVTTPVVTPTQSEVSSSATVVSLLSSNASRKFWSLFNASTQYANVSISGNASSTNYMVRMAPGAYFEQPSAINYQGAISAIWDSANGSMHVTEYV